MYLNISLFFMIFLSGCMTTLTQKDCAETNWSLKGELDGTKGVPYNQLSKYEEQCYKYNVTVNREAYIEGHQIGLKKYCTYEMGHTVGINGDTPKIACPDELKKDFERGYLTGYEIYRTKKQIQREIEQAREIAEQEIKRSQEEALRAMRQCSFDSDCGPSMRCDSEFKSIGSASGMVNVCKAR